MLWLEQLKEDKRVVTKYKPRERLEDNTQKQILQKAEEWYRQNEGRLQALYTVCFLKCPLLQVLGKDYYVKQLV